MSKLKLLFSVLLFALLCGTPQALFAQGDDCSVQNPEACTVNLSLFCQQRGEVPLSFGIDLDTFDIFFRATFAEKPTVNRFPLFFVDGEVESGNVNETRVTTLHCKGTVCSGALTVAKAEQLETTFDFDQATITVTLRKSNKFGKDICIGKFTNNPDLIAANDSSVRQICSLNTTTGNEAITGTGFFSPGGFGTDGESRFHLSIEGLDAETEYKICSVIGENKYKKVATFTPVLLATADDAAVYGTLTPKEQAEFDANPFLFSYELRRDVSNSTSSLLNQNLLSSPSLVLLNKSVSSSTSGSAVRSSNKKTSKKRRRARRRKQKNQSSRSLFSSLVRASDVTTSAASQEEVLAYLNFDPSGGSVIISESCTKNVLEQSIGTLVCGNDGEDDFRQCRFFSFSDADLSASACKEVKDDVGQLTVRVRNDEALSLTVCLDGMALNNTLEVALGTKSGDPDFPFAELKATENTALVAGDSTFLLLDSNVSDVSTVALSATGDCNDTLASVSF